MGEVRGKTCTAPQRPRGAGMASWLDTAWLWMPKLCLRLLPAQQPELGGGWRGTGFVCAAVLTQSSVQLEQWGPGDQSGSTQGMMCSLDFSSCASDSMDWVCWALDWGFGVCEWALM